MAAPVFPAAPLPLIFGPFDPSGASNLPIDAVICARMGTHGATVVTAIHVQDTTGTESIQRLGADLIDDQARCLLEDMAIGAVKIGPQYDPETISVLAQITADYSDLPLVLQLCTPPAVSDLEDLDPEETISALLELLVPQAQVLILDASLPAHWASLGLLPASQTDNPITALHECGAAHILCTRAGLGLGRDLNGVSLHSAGQPGRRWPWPTPRVRVSDAESLLATVLTCLLTQGLDPADAIPRAVDTATTLLDHHFHPGMGQRILLHTTS